jgi:integrase
MAHIRKRGARWQARYRGPDGHERARTFARKVDAERWLDSARGQLARGDWIDPAGARVTFGAYVADWQGALVARESTTATVASLVRAHILPEWEDRPLGSITRADVQQWVSRLAAPRDTSRGEERRLSPVTVEGIYRRFASIMRAAVDDRLIGSTPCRRIQLPEIPHEKVAPLPHAVVAALAEAMPAVARAIVVVAAGAGLRQGEVLGLTVDRVDFLRRTIRVDRQLVTIDRLGIALRPPKTKASVRTVPVGQAVVDELAAHLARWPAVDDGLIFADDAGRPWRRNRFGETFRTARGTAGAPRVRFHDLRHFYASVLIEAGEGPQVIKDRLGHASITETFDTYGHLFPSSDDRTRAATDAALQLLRPAVISRSAAEPDPS